MKKYLCLMLMCLLSGNAFAETFFVIDSQGVVREQFTAPQPMVTTTVTTAPAVSVVRQTPVQNTYYYDSSATSSILAAGITTAVVGGLLYGSLKHHHHHKVPALKHRGPAHRR